MTPNAQTSEANGRPWGARAADWADIQEQVHKPIYQAAFEAVNLAQDTRFLDVGCGSGLAVQMAAAQGVDASGIDAAPGLLEFAKERTPSGSFQIADLEALPFEDDTFDLVTGFNSFQYAGNPVLALTEARRVAKKDGNVVIATWGEPDGMEAAKLVATLKPFMPPPPPGSPGPFALSNETALREFAEQSLLEPVDLFDVDCPFEYSSLDMAVRGLCSAGVAVKAMELVGEDKVEDAYRVAINEFVQPDGSVRVAATLRCLVAKPSH